MGIADTTGAALGRKVGPLPIGGWAAIGIGTIVVVKLLRGGGGGGGGSGTVTVPDAFAGADGGGGGGIGGGIDGGSGGEAWYANIPGIGTIIDRPPEAVTVLPSIPAPPPGSTIPTPTAPVIPPVTTAPPVTSGPLYFRPPSGKTITSTWLSPDKRSLKIRLSDNTVKYLTAPAGKTFKSTWIPTTKLYLKYIFG